jgi:hypothetical protein
VAKEAKQITIWQMNHIFRYGKQNSSLCIKHAHVLSSLLKQQTLAKAITKIIQTKATRKDHR